jgi:tRNA(Ile2) C34 agmatinyltransferase TiaS
VGSDWENKKGRIHDRIMEFNPICIKCGYELGHIVAQINGLLCPKCKYNMVDSACQQIDLHFKGYNVPPELMNMFKKGIREDATKV